MKRIIITLAALAALSTATRPEDAASGYHPANPIIYNWPWEDTTVVDDPISRTCMNDYGLVGTPQSLNHTYAEFLCNMIDDYKNRPTNAWPKCNSLLHFCSMEECEHYLSGQWHEYPHSKVTANGVPIFYTCAQQSEPGGTWVFDDGYRPPTEENGNGE